MTYPDLVSIKNWERMLRERLGALPTSQKPDMPLRLSNES